MARIVFGLKMEDLGDSGTYGGADDVSGPYPLTFMIKTGDSVRKGDVIATIEVEKTTAEIIAPASGTIVEVIDGKEWGWSGEFAETLLLPAFGEIETDEALASAPEAPKEEAVVLAEAGAAEVEPPQVDAPAKHDPEIAVDPPPTDTPGVIEAVPRARCLARERSIDLSLITGTGPNGVIQVCDVEGVGGIPKQEGHTPRDTKILVLRPSHEWLTVAHTLEEGVGLSMHDAQGKPRFIPTPVVGATKQYDLGWLFDAKKTQGALSGWRLLAYAAVRALQEKEFWLLNGYWGVVPEDRDKDTVNLYRYVNLGIAYDAQVPIKLDLSKGTIGGQRLRIVTLHDADSLSVYTFFDALDESFGRAVAEDAKRNDWIGATFIVNNIGALGHVHGNSILPPKMSAMFNLGCKDASGICALQLFFDHRMFDGALSGRFLDAVVEHARAMVLGCER